MPLWRSHPFGSVLVVRKRNLMNTQQQSDESCRALLSILEDEKLSKEKLRESERHLKLIYDTVGDVVFYIELGKDNRYRFISANAAFCRVTGLPKEAVVGKYVDEVIPEPSLSLVLGKYRQAIEEKSIVRWEETTDYPTGRLTGEVSVAPVFDAEGNCTHLVGSVHDITGRKRSEEELRLSEDKFSKVFHNAPNGMIISRLEDGKIIEVNEAFLKIVGYSRDEVVGRTSIELNLLIQPEVRKSNIQQLRETTALRDVEFEFRCKSGEIRIGRLSIEKIEIHGELHLITFLQDVTEHKRVEETLRESEEKYKSINDSTMDIIFIIDKTGKQLFFNESVERILGYKVDEVVGKSFTKFVPKKELPKYFLQLKNVFKEKEIKNFVTQIYHKDGRLVDVEISGRLIKQKGKTVAQGSIRDITERKKVEEALHTKTEELDKFFTTSLDLLCIADTDGYFHKLNPAWEKTLGYALHELEKKKFLDFIHPDDLERTLVAISNLSSQKEVIDFTNRYRCKDDTFRLIEWQATPIGNLIYAVARDITERKRAELELKKSYQNAKELEIIINKSPAVAFLWPVDRNQPVEYVSENILQFGYTQEEMLSGRISYKDIIHPADIERINSESDHYATTGINEFTQEYRIITKSGEIRYIEDNTWVRRDKNGQISNYQGIITDITERKLAELASKRAEEKLRISEEKFSKAFRASPDAITLSDFQGLITEANEACYRHLGYDTDELIGHTSHELNIWADLTDREIYLQTLLEQKTVSNFETQFRTKTGQIQTGLISGEIIELEGTTQIISIVRDITDRKNIEKAIQQSEAKYRTLFEAANDAIFLMDFDIFIDCNSKTLKMYGCTREQIIGKTPYYFSPDVQPDGKNSKEKALVKITAAYNHQPQSFEWEHTRYDGTLFNAEVSLNAVNIDGKDYIQAMVRDITDRKLAEAKIKDSEETYRNLFQNAQVGLFRTRISDGKILESNEQLARMFGYDNREEFIAEYVTSFNYVDPGTRERMLEEIKRNGYVKNFEAHFYRKDHTSFWVKYSAKIYVDKGWIEGVAEDITEQKQTEEALRKSEAQYRCLHESMTDSFVQTTMSGEIVEVNRSYCDMLGYNNEEIKLLKYQDITPERWHEFEQKIVEEQVLPLGYSNVYEKEYIKKDGTVFPVELRTYLLQDNSGNPSGMWAIVRDITERKKTEIKIKKQSELLQSVFDNIPVMIAYFDERGKILFANHELIEKLGWSFKEWQTENILAKCYPEPADLKEAIDFMINKPGGWKDFKTTTKYGTVLDTAWTNILLPDGRSMGIGQDITERKRSEMALRESELKLKNIFEHSTNVFYSHDTNHILHYLSPQIKKILGYEVQEALINWTELTSDNPVNDIGFQKTVKAIETGEAQEPYELELIHKNGKKVWVDVREAPVVENGNTIAIVGSLTDITERKLAELANKQAEEEIKQINEDLRTINRIILTSASALDLKALFDIVMDEAIHVVGLEGGTICLIDPDDTFKLAVERGASQETIEDLTQNKVKVGDYLCGNCAKDCKPLILQTKEDVLEYATREVLRGEDIRFHAAFPFVVAEKCVGVLCVFTRTDLKPSERSLKLLESIVAQTAVAIENARLFEEVNKYTLQLEEIVSERTAELLSANKELEAFSYSVSHDLRAPLRAIDGFSLALLEDYLNKLDDEGKHYLQRIRNGATEMAQLIEDLLNLSRITRRELIRGTVDISKIVKSISDKLIESESGRKVTFSITDNIRVEGDNQLLKIALENLLNNAWKFTGKKKNAKIEFGVWEKEGKTVYYIKDNGVGFDMKYADKLFSPFQRLHKKEDYPGTGIGLATVKRIISKHSGSIWAESELGKGATFFFTVSSR